MSLCYQKVPFDLYAIGLGTGTILRCAVELFSL